MRLKHGGQIFHICMVSCKPVPMCEKNPAAGIQQKQAALLPMVTGGGSPAESLTQGPYCPQDRRRTKGPPSTTDKAEGAISSQVGAGVKLPGEPCFDDKFPCLFGTSAADGRQRDSEASQLFPGLNKGSHLLPREQSTEMTKKGQQQRGFGPERNKGEFHSLRIQNVYIVDRDCHVFAAHGDLLAKGCRNPITTDQ